MITIADYINNNNNRLTWRSDRRISRGFSRVLLLALHIYDYTHNSIGTGAPPSYSISPPNASVYPLNLEDPVKIAIKNRYSIYLLFIIIADYTYKNAKKSSYLNIVFRIDEQTASFIYEFIPFGDQFVRFVA